MLAPALIKLPSASLITLADVNANAEWDLSLRWHFRATSLRRKLRQTCEKPKWLCKRTAC